MLGSEYCAVILHYSLNCFFNILLSWSNVFLGIMSIFTNTIWRLGSRGFWQIISRTYLLCGTLSQLLTLFLFWTLDTCSSPSFCRYISFFIPNFVTRFFKELSGLAFSKLRRQIFHFLAKLFNLSFWSRFSWVSGIPACLQTDLIALTKPGHTF